MVKKLVKILRANQVINIPKKQKRNYPNYVKKKLLRIMVNGGVQEVIVNVLMQKNGQKLYY